MSDTDTADSVFVAIHLVFLPRAEFYSSARNYIDRIKINQ